jgi:choline kinase
VRSIIPAAGQGLRLRPHTEHLPKCLVEIGGASILSQLLRRLNRAGVSEVIIVLGYRASQLREHVAAIPDAPRVAFVTNSRYATSNSITSVLATSPWWNDDFVIIDSDILVSQGVIDRLITDRGDAIVVDVTRPADAVDMGVELRAGAVWDLGKGMPAERLDGEALPLSRWTVEGGRDLHDVMSRMVRSGQDDVWYQYAMREVAKQRRVEAIHARSDDWIEIDAPDDLARAVADYQNGTAWSRA